jgi:hypothetical protein
MLVNVAVATALTALPVALAPSGPAPTNVELAWVSDQHQEFALTWDETGDVRNKIEILQADGSPSGRAPRFTEAGQPNRLTTGTSDLADTNLFLRVTVVDADGTALSPPADSPVFDTDLTVAPVITSAVPAVDGSITLSWVPGKYTDPNPGDPLDLPGEPRYQPVASVLDLNEYRPVGDEVRGAGSLVFHQAIPVSVGLLTKSEWSGERGAGARINGTRVTAKIPAKATIGGKLTVTGTAIALRRACDPGPCWIDEQAYGGRELKLQRRTNKDAAWQTVATTATRDDGTYKFAAAFAATGDYRVIAPPVGWVNDAGFAYGETAATTVTGVTAPVTGGGTDDGGTGGGLPITGAPAMLVALAGALLVAVGAAFAAAGRPRRRTAD